VKIERCPQLAKADGERQRGGRGTFARPLSLRAPRAATTGLRAWRPDCVAGLGGLELANVTFGKPLKYCPYSLWFQRTLWDLRPFAHELQLNSVEMTSAGSSPLSPIANSCLRKIDLTSNTNVIDHGSTAQRSPCALQAQGVRAMTACTATDRFRSNNALGSSAPSRPTQRNLSPCMSPPAVMLWLSFPSRLRRSRPS